MSYNGLKKEDFILILADIQKEVRELRENVSEIALIDDITNLYNRKLLCKTLEYEMRRMEVGHGFLSVLLLEIDNFDDIREIYGEEVSNAILEQVSELILRSTRSIDIVGKYDKNKIMLILPDINFNKGWIVADRITKMIEEGIYPMYSEVKISIGMKNYEGESAKDLFEIDERNPHSQKNGIL